jgi:hypothetical protein
MHFLARHGGCTLAGHHLINHASRRNDMRLALSTAALLCALPAFAAAAPPAVPPATSPVLYEVWGFRWDGHQYVKQADHCLKTPDPKQAADYAAEVNRFPGWAATSNAPGFKRSSPARGAADIDFGPIHIRGNADGSQMVYMPNMSVRVPASTVAGNHWTFSSNGGGADVGTSSDTSVQDSVALQDMLNQQQMNNNTQNMINTQNTVNEQNMINSMNQ